MIRAQDESKSLLNFETQHPEVFRADYVPKVSHPHSRLLSKIEWEVRLIPVVLTLAVLALVIAGISSHFVEPVPIIGGILFFILLLIAERFWNNKCEYGD